MVNTSSKDIIERKAAAFFDLDHTLIRSNSGRILFRYAWKKGHVTRSDLARGIYLSFLHRFNLRDTVEIMAAFTKRLKGLSVSEMEEISLEMFNIFLVHDLRQEVVERIAVHRNEEKSIVMLSSALYPVCKIVADHLRMDDVVCSELETFDGIYTGNPAGKFCFGSEKSARLLKYCEGNNLDPGSSIYYGDSITDLPVMNSVGKAVCVSPDKELFREAVIRRWEIIPFNTSTSHHFL